MRKAKLSRRSAGQTDCRQTSQGSICSTVSPELSGSASRISCIGPTATITSAWSPTRQSLRDCRCSRRAATPPSWPQQALSSHAPRRATRGCNHPPPVVKPALAGEDRLPLRSSDRPERKTPLGRRSGDEGAVSGAFLGPIQACESSPIHPSPACAPRCTFSREGRAAPDVQRESGSHCPHVGSRCFRPMSSVGTAICEAEARQVCEGSTGSHRPRVRLGAGTNRGAIQSSAVGGLTFEPGFCILARHQRAAGAPSEGGREAWGLQIGDPDVVFWVTEGRVGPSWCA